MALTITKVSGVIFVLDSTLGATNSKAYFGATGTYQLSDSNTTVAITITSASGVTTTQYTGTLGTITIGTSTPSTKSSLLVLLNAIFGT